MSRYFLKNLFIFLLNEFFFVISKLCFDFRSVNSTSVTVSGLSAFSNFKMYIENCTTKDRISEMIDVNTKADGKFFIDTLKI